MRIGIINTPNFSESNLIFICFIISEDINDKSKKTNPNQIDFKNHINDLIKIALKFIDQNERIILKNSDGALISYLGSSEDAMLMAIEMREEILKANAKNLINLNVRSGIHLDLIKALENFDSQSNIIAIGINAAKRIISFAKPNEIIVSRSYYENASALTQSLAKMYDDGIDKNVDHVGCSQASLVITDKNITISELQKSISFNNLFSLNDSAFLKNINWKYAFKTSLIFITIFSVIKFITLPNQSTIPIVKIINADPEKVSINLPINFKRTKNDVETQDNKQQKALVKTEVIKNKIYKSRDINSKFNKTREKSVWMTLINNIKHGQKNKCTQSEIAMKQCN